MTLLSFAGASDVGRKRLDNQDRFGLYPDLNLCIVADGMGGAAAGEVAACMTVELVREAMSDADITWPPGFAAPPAPGLPRLVAAIQRANARVHGTAQARPECRGMGSTIAAALVHGDQAAVAHVGDSRIYRWRDGHLTLLTEDHSVFNELVRRGLTSPDARRKPFVHVITRAIGVEPTVAVEARLVGVVPGDTLLLCTDGLSGVVPAAEIADILRREWSLDDAVRQLLARANHHGGPDNVTVVLMRAEVLGTAGGQDG